ncbi:hypothetical protein BG000_006566, partial [Podila horticola]
MTKRRLPLRVLYSRDPLTIIVHKAPPDHDIVPLSKGLRIEPERTLSASTRIRKSLYRTLFRSNSVPVAPMDSIHAHYYHQTRAIVTEKTGDSQLVKIPESLNEAMPLPPTTPAPLPRASQMPSAQDEFVTHSYGAAHYYGEPDQQDPYHGRPHSGGLVGHPYGHSPQDNIVTLTPPPSAPQTHDPPPLRTCLTNIIWEDERTYCFQVDVK